MVCGRLQVEGRGEIQLRFPFSSISLDHRFSCSQPVWFPLSLAISVSEHNTKPLQWTARRCIRWATTSSSASLAFSPTPSPSPRISNTKWTSTSSVSTVTFPPRHSQLSCRTSSMPDASLPILSSPSSLVWTRYGTLSRFIRRMANPSWAPSTLLAPMPWRTTTPSLAPAQRTSTVRARPCTSSSLLSFLGTNPIWSLRNCLRSFPRSFSLPSTETLTAAGVPSSGSLPRTRSLRESSKHVWIKRRSAMFMSTIICFTFLSSCFVLSRDWAYHNEFNKRKENADSSFFKHNDESSNV